MGQRKPEAPRPHLVLRLRRCFRSSPLSWSAQRSFASSTLPLTERCLPPPSDGDRSCAQYIALPDCASAAPCLVDDWYTDVVARRSLGGPRLGLDLYLGFGIEGRVDGGVDVLGNACHTGSLGQRGGDELLIAVAARAPTEVAEHDADGKLAPGGVAVARPAGTI